MHSKSHCKIFFLLMHTHDNQLITESKIAKKKKPLRFSKHSVVVTVTLEFLQEVFFVNFYGTGSKIF